MKTRKQTRRDPDKTTRGGETKHIDGLLTASVCETSGKAAFHNAQRLLRSLRGRQSVRREHFASFRRPGPPPSRSHEICSARISPPSALLHANSARVKTARTTDGEAVDLHSTERACGYRLANRTERQAAGYGETYTPQFSRCAEW